MRRDENVARRRGSVLYRPDSSPDDCYVGSGSSLAKRINFDGRLSIDSQPNALNSPYGLDEQCSAKAIFIDKPPR